MKCAIYTRKSAEEREDAVFGSLENQRAYCAAYIASQGGQGWTELPTHYDDNGFSGGSLKRPALDRLRSDIAAGVIDTIVVYKIDRLSRSLTDFANLVSELESHGTTFVSVTQSFDTGTAMGRLTLNVLLSFAQFERDLTGERLRDWFAGARDRGLWTQQRPFGYTKPEGTHYLVPHPDEVATVRWIFRRYIAIKSAERVADELFRRGVVNTRGRPWTGNMIRHTIAHPIYLGKLVHRREAMPGMHEPIVSQTLWRRANTILSAKRTGKPGKNNKPPALLAGLIYDRLGQRLTHTWVRSKGHAYRYYIAQQERRHGYGESSNPYMRFQAGPLELSVIRAVERMTGMSIANIPSRSEQRERIRGHVSRIDLSPDTMSISFFAGAEIVTETDGRMSPRKQLRREKRSRPIPH